MAFALAGRYGEVIASVAVDSDTLKRGASRSFSGVHERLRPKAIPGAPRYADNGADHSCGSGGFFPDTGLAKQSGHRIQTQVTQHCWVSPPLPRSCRYHAPADLKT